MTDFSVPQRMSPGAFFIYFLKFFKIIFNAAVILLAYKIFRSDGGVIENLLKITFMIGGIAALALILASIAFFKIKFHVEGGNLIYRHHLLRSATTTVPLDRIHTLRTRQGLLYRLFAIRGILFDTLASKEEEIELILTESDWRSLLMRIEQQERPYTDTTPAHVCNPSSFRKFSNKDLVLDALCQNHLKGMVILGGFASVIFSHITDLSENAIDMMAGYLESHLDHFTLSVAGIAIIMAFTYIVSLVLWLGKVLMRYYDLSLTYNSTILTFTHGLFSRLSTRFARNKICTLCIKRNYFEKRSGLCTLSMKQAFNSSGQKEENDLKIYGHDSSGFFLGWWLGQDYTSEAAITAAKSGKGVIIHSLLPDLLLSSVTTAALWYAGLYSWIILPAIYLSAAIPKSILTMRHSHITLRESYLIIANGRFAEIKNYLKYSNIEVVNITRTPLSRFTGRVSLSLSTSGTNFTVRSLPQDDALLVYELLLAKSNSSTSPCPMG